ncbi:TPA: helix-turn-helix domain-containing protein [Clostridioides difficile]
MINLELKNTLKELRKENGLTQADVAAKIGLTKSAYGYYEQGKTVPDAYMLSNLAKIFDVSTDYLLGKTNVRENKEISESELIDTLNFSDNVKDALKMISKLSPASQEKMFKLAKVFFEEEINEKK